MQSYYKECEMVERVKKGAKGERKVERRGKNEAKEVQTDAGKARRK